MNNRHEWIDFVLSLPQLSGGTVRVATFLYRRTGDNGRCWPTQEQIAAGIGRDTTRGVRKALKQLIELSLIEVDRGHRNEYRLVLKVELKQLINKLKTTGTSVPTTGTSVPVVEPVKTPTTGTTVPVLAEPPFLLKRNERAGTTGTSVPLLVKEPLKEPYKEPALAAVSDPKSSESSVLKDAKQLRDELSVFRVQLSVPQCERLLNAAWRRKIPDAANWLLSHLPDVRSRARRASAAQLTDMAAQDIADWVAEPVTPHGWAKWQRFWHITRQQYDEVLKRFGHQQGGFDREMIEGLAEQIEAGWIL